MQRRYRLVVTALGLVCLSFDLVEVLDQLVYLRFA
jgi:hypothetical protein